jgi:hypothetical protein
MYLISAQLLRPGIAETLRMTGFAVPVLTQTPY